MIPFFQLSELHVGPVALHVFGLCVLAGLLAGMGTAGAIARHRGDPTWPHVVNALVGGCAGLVGGHVLYVAMYARDRAIADPLEWFRVWNGLSTTATPLFVEAGTVLVLALAGPKRFFRQLDAAVLGSFVALMSFRLGCFLVHDHPGVETTFFLGIQGICPMDRGGPTACHDLGLYELVGVAVLLVAGAALARRMAPGISGGAMLAAYGAMLIPKSAVQDHVSWLQLGGAIAYGIDGIAVIGLGLRASPASPPPTWRSK
jgi:phosphatidylglycerol:prolipoprotein diacylglycerol transferase